MLFNKLQLRLSPDHAEALVALGRCLLERKLFIDATSTLSKAASFWCEFDPSNRKTAVALRWNALALSGAGQAETGRLRC